VSPHPPPSPSWQKSHLLAPYRCVKFEREKKLYFFFVEEIVFLDVLALCVSSSLASSFQQIIEVLTLTGLRSAAQLDGPFPSTLRANVVRCILGQTNGGSKSAIFRARPPALPASSPSSAACQAGLQCRRQPANRQTVAHPRERGCTRGTLS
jgi:hypothetical protein